jgi:hypothetical protein
MAWSFLVWAMNAECCRFPPFDWHEALQASADGGRGADSNQRREVAGTVARTDAVVVAKDDCLAYRWFDRSSFFIGRVGIPPDPAG